MDKREQAINAVIKEAYLRQHGALRGGKQYSIDEQYQLIFQRGAEYGAAEGVPQADGWVDVAVSLPPAKEGWNHSEQCLVWYQPSLDAVGNYGIAYYHYDPPYRPCEWVDFAHLGRDPIAWQPLPTPYQRQSSEGDVKTNIFESRGWDGK